MKDAAAKTFIFVYSLTFVGSRTGPKACLLLASSPCKMICLNTYSTRIKDAGIAIRHSRGYAFSILQGLEMGWKGWNRCVPSQEITLMNQFKAKISKIQFSPKSQKSQNGFANQPSPIFDAAHPFSRYLAPLGAKHLEKPQKKYKKHIRF